MKHKIREFLISLEVDLQVVANWLQPIPNELKAVIIAGFFLVVTPITYFAAEQSGVVPPISEVLAPLTGPETALDETDPTLWSDGQSPSESQNRDGSAPSGSGPADEAISNGSSGNNGNDGTNGNPTTPGNPPTIPLFSSYCLARTGNTVTVSGLRKAQYRNVSVTANTIFNATDAYWDGTRTDGSPIPWVITLDGQGSSCWYGGKYTGVWDDTSPSVTWDEPYHHAGAMTIRMSNFLVEGLRAHNQGDGIRMESGGSNFHIRGVYMSDIHDDCVENDYNHSGITEDSLFDGCYAGFSATNFNNDNAANKLWKIENNLVHMKAFMTVHNPQYFIDRGCAPAPNYMFLFKGFIGNEGPRVSLKNNIFKYDQPQCTVGTSVIPTGMDLAECSNNILVYTGPGNFNKSVPSCITVTKDVSVWNNAVAKWKQSHPHVSQ